MCFNKLFKGALLFVSSYFLCFTSSAQMSGTYVVGGINADFNTISDAVNSLSTNGVSGPVIINISAGTYNEFFTIPSISGSSSNNTITIQGATLDSSDVIIQSVFGGTPDHIILLDGVDYLTIRYCTITWDGFAPSSKNNIIVSNGSENCTIENCHIFHPFNTSQHTPAVIGVWAFTAFHSHNFTLRNNYIHGGSHGVTASGSNTEWIDGITISGNVFTNQGGYGVDLFRTVNPEVSDNIVMDQTVLQGSGIRVRNCDSSLVVSGNRVMIEDSGNTNLHGILVEWWGSHNTRSPALIFNNMVSVLGQGIKEGIDVEGSFQAQVNHNSAYINSDSPWAFALQVNNGSDNQVFNNNLYSGGRAPAISFESGGQIQSDNNNLYTIGDTIATIETFPLQAYTSLGTFTVASGTDSNSISVFPDFFSPLDLHSNQPLIRDMGKAGTGILVDIDGDLRSNPPDLGADEFYQDTTCNVSQVLFAEPITPISARLNWDVVPDAHHYTIRGKRVGTSFWTNINIPSSLITSKDVFGLSYNTTYTWQIRSHCNVDETISSVWSVLDTFTTTCMGTDSVWVNPISNNGAQLNWNPVIGAAAYEIKGKRVGAASWTTLLLPNTQNSKSIFGLQPNTSYNWTIRSWCDTFGIKTSTFSELDTFTTMSMFRNSDSNQQHFDSSPFVQVGQNGIKIKAKGDKIMRIELISPMGRIIGNAQRFSNATYRISTANLPAGIYFLHSKLENFKTEYAVVFIE